MKFNISRTHHSWKWHSMFNCDYFSEVKLKVVKFHMQWYPYIQQEALIYSSGNRYNLRNWSKVKFADLSRHSSFLKLLNFSCSATFLPTVSFPFTTHTHKKWNSKTWQRKKSNSSTMINFLKERKKDDTVSFILD